MKGMSGRLVGRLAGSLVLSVLGFVVLLVVEALLSFRVQRIDGYTSAELDRKVGGPPFIRALWIGDSTTAGVGASAPDRTVPLLVAEAIDRGVDTEVRSISGATIQDALTEQTDDLAASGADVIFIGVGNNDVTHLVSRAKVRARMREILRRAAAAKPAEIVVLGVANFGGSPLLPQPLRWVAGVRAHQLDTEVRQVAREFDATFVPIADLTHEGFAADPVGTHAQDRFHPSDAGYQLWVDAIVQTLEVEGVMDRLRAM